MNKRHNISSNSYWVIPKTDNVWVGIKNEQTTQSAATNLETTTENYKENANLFNKLEIERIVRIHIHCVRQHLFESKLNDRIY